MSKKIAVLAAVMSLVSSSAFAHIPEGTIYGAFQWPTDKLPVLDGDISEWDVLPAEVWIDSDNPDIIVGERPDGSWSITLNPETLPRVLVNRDYHARVWSAAQTEGDKTFIADCLQSANWLTRSLDQRARTIVKVTAEIVRQQDGFLLNGVSHLRPLTLKSVADAIDMHESTVSRVTANKYAMTPRGIFELRYFFTVALASAAGGDAHSAETVRHRIRSLIDAEQPSKILSDDAIVEILQSNGIEIARRTVAKYREALGIPSSVQRRRQKRMALAASA